MLVSNFTCIVYRYHTLESSFSFVRLFATQWSAVCQAFPSNTNSQRLLKVNSFKLVMLSNILVLRYNLLPLSSTFPSIRVFTKGSVALIRWPKDWSFSFSISPCNEHSDLISIRIDWLDPPAVQGTRKSLLQHHSSKASILWGTAFIIAQFSHPYMTSRKTTAVARRTFVIMSLLFNKLSQFSSGCSLISSLSSVPFSPIAQLCPTLCNPMDLSTPGRRVHHQLLEFTKTHVHWVSDAIQPSHPLLPLYLLPSIPSLQGTLKSLLQQHSSKASLLQHSAFLIVQLSHPYMITGKTTALTRRTFVDKVMSLLFNTLSRLVINVPSKE